MTSEGSSPEYEMVQQIEIAEQDLDIKLDEPFCPGDPNVKRFKVKLGMELCLGNLVASQISQY